MPARAPHSRPERAQLGPSSFLVTFQGRKLDVPLMPVEAALPPTPVPVCVYVHSVSCLESLFLEQLETEKKQPQASQGQSLLPPALPWSGGLAGLCAAWAWPTLWPDRPSLSVGLGQRDDKLGGFN